MGSLQAPVMLSFLLVAAATDNDFWRAPPSVWFALVTLLALFMLWWIAGKLMCNAAALQQKLPIENRGVCCHLHKIVIIVAGSSIIIIVNCAMAVPHVVTMIRDQAHFAKTKPG